MKNKIINFLDIWLFTIASAILIYLGSSDCIENLAKHNIVGSQVNISLFKNFSTIAGIVLQAVSISYRFNLAKNKVNNMNMEMEGLIKYCKETFLKLLENRKLISHNNINIRIFTPEKAFWMKLVLNKLTFGIYKVRKKFKIKNINGLAEKGNTEGLSFEVSPNPVGLVGKCYNDKYAVYDDNLKINNANYGLSRYQISKTQDLEFCLCIPLFNKDDEVTSIVSFDIQKRITIDSAKKGQWIHLTTSFCQTLRDYVPELFK
ncbi:MAG: hypothetical protein GX211_09830 [Clostridiaceae bacterium]|nr:hypothetical protein [Clostridiaceae bacterium]